MWWTDFVKAMCKILLSFAIIIFTIAGIYCLAKSQTAQGLFFLFGGNLAALVSFSITIMFCEISQNISKIAESVSKEMPEEDSTDEDSINEEMSKYGEGVQL